MCTVKAEQSIYRTLAVARVSLVKFASLTEIIISNSTFFCHKNNLRFQH